MANALKDITTILGDLLYKLKVEGNKVVQLHVYENEVKKVIGRGFNIEKFKLITRHIIIESLDNEFEGFDILYRREKIDKDNPAFMLFSIAYQNKENNLYGDIHFIQVREGEYWIKPGIGEGIFLTSNG